MTRTSTRPTLSKCIPLPNKHLEVGVSNKCLVLFSSRFPFSPQHHSRKNLNRLPFTWLTVGEGRGEGGEGCRNSLRRLLFHQAPCPLANRIICVSFGRFKKSLVKYVRFSGQKTCSFPFVSPRTGPLKTVITGGDKGTESHSKVTEGLGEGRLVSCPWLPAAPPCTSRNIRRPTHLLNKCLLNSVVFLGFLWCGNSSWLW